MAELRGQDEWAIEMQRHRARRQQQVRWLIAGALCYILCVTTEKTTK
jgi:hypothetical protein